MEALYNFVEQSTGVRVKERVPDEVLTKADQIVNIDLPAEDLQERLQAGKIYPKERIESALANVFTQKNLTRLREITLTETANYLDRQQRDTSGSAMVCRYVRTPEESAVNIDPAAQHRVTHTLETAQKVGGLVFSMKGEDVAQALLSFAREYGITHIVANQGCGMSRA